MRLLGLFLMFLFLIGCKHHYYEGYVHDAFDKKPISGMQVLDLVNGTKTVTDHRGYFKLLKNNDISSTLIFQKKPDYHDTISSIQIKNGEQQKRIIQGRKYIYTEK